MSHQRSESEECEVVAQILRRTLDKGRVRGLDVECSDRNAGCNLRCQENCHVSAVVAHSAINRVRKTELLTQR